MTEEMTQLERKDRVAKLEGQVTQLLSDMSSAQKELKGLKQQPEMVRTTFVIHAWQLQIFHKQRACMHSCVLCFPNIKVSTYAFLTPGLSSGGVGSLILVPRLSMVLNTVLILNPLTILLISSLDPSMYGI